MMSIQVVWDEFLVAGSDIIDSYVFKFNSNRSGARRLKFDKDGGRSKLVKGRFEIDMDEFGVDRDVIRTSSTRSIR